MEREGGLLKKEWVERLEEEEERGKRLQRTADEEGGGVEKGRTTPLL